MESEHLQEIAAVLFPRIQRLERVVFRLSVAVILNLVIALLAVWIALRSTP